MLHHIFDVQIDWTLTLTTIVNAVVGAILLAIGHGLLKLYGVIKAFVVCVQSFDDRLEETAMVVDGHSIALKKLGQQDFPKVAQQRRETDRSHRIFI